MVKDRSNVSRMVPFERLVDPYKSYHLVKMIVLLFAIELNQEIVKIIFTIKVFCEYLIG